jgi:hypothetical protein
VAENKQPYILLSLYQALYKDKYNKQPKLNKYRDKWAMQDVIDTVGYDRAKELVEYYFKTGKIGHPLQFFFYNFDSMDRIKEESDKDKLNRIKLREQTKRMVEE